MRRASFAFAALALAACASDASQLTSSAAPALTLAPIAIEAGDSLPVPVTVNVSGATRVPVAREISVTSSDTSIIAIAPNGAILGVGDGTATITVQWTATPSVTVSQSVAVTSERLVGVRLLASGSMTPGDTAVVSVTGTIRGNRMIQRPLSVVVSSHNPGVVTTNGAIAIAVAPGTTWIVARASSGVSDSVFVTVAGTNTAAPSDGGYVQIRWVGGTASPAVAAAFESARLRINGLFKSFGNVPPTRVDLAAAGCMAGAPAIGETVPGLLIFAQVTTIDGVGNILGSAGPCLLRSDTWLPIIGSMQFDVADMNAMVANGSLNGVVLHEMMHTLGFGTIWGPDAQSEVASPDGTDPRYVGAIGRAEYAALGATDAAQGAPVENTGGTGTRGSHWRESVFRTELMTGWADGSLAMSRVTIGALKDFGYDVDLNKADPFTLSPPPTSATLRAPQRIVEQAIAPIGIVDPTGRITPYTGPVAH